MAIRDDLLLPPLRRLFYATGPKTCASAVILLISKLCKYDLFNLPEVESLYPTHGRRNKRNLDFKLHHIISVIFTEQQYNYMLRKSTFMSSHDISWFPGLNLLENWFPFTICQFGHVALSSVCFPKPRW